MVDVTFARLEPGVLIDDWRVRTELNSESDHNYVSYTVTSGSLPRRDISCEGGWAVKKLDGRRLCEALSTEPVFAEGGSAESMADSIQVYLTRVCEHSMPRRGTFSRRRAVYWWSEAMRSCGGIV